MADRRRRGTPADGGFTLIELLISIVLSGAVMGVLASALQVYVRNDTPTMQRFDGANGSLSATNRFSADIASTPPGGREVGTLPSECAGTDRGTNVLRLTWSEANGTITTWYRVNYRFDAVNKQLLRVTCQSTTGPHAGYSSASAGPMGNTVLSATLLYTDLDAQDISLVLGLDTRPPSTITVRAARVNVPATLPPAAQSTAALVQIQTTTADLQYTTVGQVLHFSTVVVNSGATMLNAIGVTDPAADPGSLSCDVTSLSPGANATCAFTHTTTQADLDGGNVTSSSAVTATDPSSAQVTNTAIAVNVPAVQAPQLTVVSKVAKDTVPATSPLSFKLVGDKINYELTLKNSGNVTLSGLTVSDPKADSVPGCSGTVAPGQTVTCAYTYTVQASDLGGPISSAATATASSPAPASVTATATSQQTSVPFQASPSLEATLSANRSYYGLVGDAITYTLSVRNTGNVPLNTLQITPTNSTSYLGCAATLAVGASTTCTATHAVQPGEAVSGGSITASATVSVQPASGGPRISTGTGTVTATFDATRPVLTITKQWTSTTPSLAPLTSSYKLVGDRITYTFTVKNSGAVDITGLTIGDPRVDSWPSPCPPTLAVGATATCIGGYSVTSADLGLPVSSAATAAADNGAAATSNSVTVNFVPAPQLAASMSANPSPSFNTLGQVINYAITVTNTGNTPLTALAVVNQGLAPVTCAGADLAVGASTTCTAAYTTTQADASRPAGVSNQVSFSATYSTTTVTAATATITVSSTVPCSVTSITASPGTVSRKGGGGNNAQQLAGPVNVTASATGICSGLRIRYFPNGTQGGVTTPGVIDNMVASGSTWTFSIPSGGSSASNWVVGPAQVDVLPSTGAVALFSATPFTVTS